MDAGNSFAGIFNDPGESRARARLLMKIYHKAGYEFVAVGSKDLDLGTDFLMKESGRNHLRLLSANIYKDGKRVFAPYAVTTVKGVRVGIVGLTDYKGNGFSNKRGFTVKEPEGELKYAVEKLKAEGVGFIILMSDIPQRRLNSMLSAFEDIDLVIMGGRNGTTRNPLRMKYAYALSPPPKGKGLGVARITISNHGKILEISNTPIKLRANIDSDKKVAQEVKAVLSSIKQEKKGKKERPQANSLENPFLKALREAQKRHLSGQPPRDGNHGANATGVNPFLNLLKQGRGKGDSTQPASR